MRPWVSRTIPFSRTFLPHTYKMWNEIPSEVFPLSYDVSVASRKIFKKLLRVGIASRNPPVLPVSKSNGDHSRNPVITIS